MELWKKLKPKLAVDKKMLPMKLHYLFYSTALGSIMLYFPLMAKDIGISTTGLGTVYTIVPFSTILFAPIFGLITDKFQKIRNILILLIILQTPVYFALNYIPEISVEKEYMNVNISCQGNNLYFFTSNSSLNSIPPNKTFDCEMECAECIKAKSNDTIFCESSITFLTEPINQLFPGMIEINMTSVNGKSVSLNCSQDLSNVCQAKCLIEAKRVNEFTTYQFWMYLCLMIVGLVMTNVLLSLSDAACHEKLKGDVKLFGKQRIWLSLGWGLISFITGPIVELANANNTGRVDYSACFYMMLPLMAFDIIALTQTELRKEKSSNQILKDVSKLFIKIHLFFILSAAFLVGAFCAIQWNYMFWYLDDMGASKIVMGISIAVVCLFAEVPFMFISGWLIEKIGRDNCIVIVFFSFAAWLIPATYIYNPWYIVLLNMVQGPSYGLFVPTMSTYAKVNAPPGTEATLQTIMTAAFYGFGVGSGSLIGGIGFDKLGGRKTFFITGLVALTACVVYKLLTMFVADEHSMQSKQTEMKEIEKEKKFISAIEIPSLVMEDKVANFVQK